MKPGELVNIAPYGAATQSSLSQWSLPSGAQALVEDAPGDFACHTGLDQSPWWRLDLGDRFPIQVIEIFNRSTAYAQDRARRLRVEVSEYGDRWTLLHSGLSFFGDGQNRPAMRIELYGRVTARFVRLSLPEQGYLHLKHVRVFVLGRDYEFIRAWTANGFPKLEPFALTGGRYHDPKYALAPGSGSPSDKLQALKITPYGRLGNNVIQITNAVFLARKLDVPYVQAPEIDWHAGPASIRAQAPSLLAHEEEPPVDGPCLEGNFYFLSVFGDNYVEELTSDVRRKLTQEYIVPFLGIEHLTPSSSSSDSELVVHIRSGDIFIERPHPDYAQPPLSYYTTIIDEMRERGEIDRVCIVCEDRMSPCVGALEDYLAESDMPVRLQNGSLFEDLRCLLSASRLVFGYGTFGYAICLLARQLRSVHAFRTFLYSDLPNVTDLTIADIPQGQYIFLGEWTGSAAQLDLMTSFPAENIQWTKFGRVDA